MLSTFYDVVIIGGGINGSGCAADAALRGLSVLLCEKEDIASKTSSNSSKLIHGGLRYLEHFQFRMVKKALDERQRLLQLAPHLVHPLPFVLPYQKKARSAWVLGIGLFLYDHLSRMNALARSQSIRQRDEPQYFSPLASQLTAGFVFYDCKTDDARLTIANALQAKIHGATVLTRTELIAAHAVDGKWHLTLQPQAGNAFEIEAAAVINASGPCVESVANRLHTPREHSISLVKGSHLVIQKLYEGEHAYVLQHDDKRIVFVIPYEGNTLIGTTEIVLTDPGDPVRIDPEEVHYLLALVNTYFKKQVRADDIMTTFSGIRALVADNTHHSALSRDFAYHYSQQPAPAVTIYSGKITTYRQLALHAVDALRAIFPDLPASHTDKMPLPGAVWGNKSLMDYQKHMQKKYHWLNDAVKARYLATYGTGMEAILAHCTQETDLGIDFGSTLYQAEVDYLVQHEWAMTTDDILWRRTKLGLQMDAQGEKALADYLLGLLD